MRASEVKEFVERLGVALPPLERFWALGDVTALRQDDGGHFYRANYERGILLYALVAARRPATILEFGTGRGFGCLCMAWAMEDAAIPGQIFTIDMVGHDERFEWILDRGTGRRVEHLARRDVWREVVPASWRDRIEILTGWSGRVISRWKGPAIDFAFIDGGHEHRMVRHDFYSCLQLAGPRLGILFDDYAPQPGFGVQQLIDDEVCPHFEAELVYTDRRWPGGERAALADPGYGMVWIHSDSLKRSIDDVYPRAVRTAVLRAHRRFELRRILRRKAKRVLIAGAGLFR